MPLKSIKLRNFRNHEELYVEFDDSTTLITGPNGSGKTSVLEAIYCLYRGSSFRSSDGDIIQSNKGWYYVEVSDDSGGRSLGYKAADQGVAVEKRFTIDAAKYSRLTQKNKHPIVLFSPDDLQLLIGSPARRRRYIDTAIGQIVPGYTAIIRRYERSIFQRNRTLKSPNCSSDLLFSWNVMIAEYGTIIIEERLKFVDMLRRGLTQHYRAISHTVDELDIEYQHNKLGKQSFLASLEKSYERDRAHGATSIGPHRHDIVVSLNGKSAISTASRGENRSIILTLKHIESELYKKSLGTDPLILLDDVFGELDTDRRSQIPKLFSNSQIIITSVDEVSGINKTVRL